MNMFWMSPSPQECARWHDDQRLVKMVLETAQMLSTAMYLNGDQGPYRKTHAGHPCTLWTQQSYGSALALFEALHTEYQFRYQKDHKSYREHHDTFWRYWRDHYRLCGFGRRPVLCAPGIEPSGDVYKDYRRYMAAKWDAKPPRFNRGREAPKWYGH